VKKHLGLLLSIGLIAMLVLAACGDDDDGNENGNGAGNGGDSVSLEMGEMYFEPNSISATAGTSLSVDLENAGSMLHDFTIDDLGGERVHVEVAGGESDSFTLDIPDESGTYEFYCSVPGHREAGMEGTIEVN
jgi:uncharacterized cupredoxin-like copper-binding protein